MTKKTWVEIFNQIADYKERYPSIRLGQAISSWVTRNFPNAQMPSGEVDPFYNDKNIVPFIIAFIHKYYEDMDGFPEEGGEYEFPHQAWNESKLAKYQLKHE